MAKMIPTQIDKRAPNSERKVFIALRDDPATNGWIVLHSLGLARRGYGKPYGEIDFVVVVPGEGVICLEVKGGRVSCRDGDWYSVDRHGVEHRLSRSPFMQAREGMHALKRSLENSLSGRLPPIGYAVIFPDIACPPLMPEFERCEAIDYEDLRSPISGSILRYARERLREFQPRGGGRKPSASEASAIRNMLRPDFDRVVARSVKIERIEEKLLSLTQEQYERLDELEDNWRCLFRGGAGTGKTLLAVESARRAALNGEKVLLVCFTRLLAVWMREQLADVEVRVDTWHEVARDFIRQSSIGKDFQEEEGKVFASGDPGREQKFFGETYHLYAAMAMEEYIDARGRPFDRLIIDEAQDLIGDENTVEFLDLTLKNGLSRGRWAVFGDFNHQTLFGGTMDPIDVLENYTDNFVRARLTLNCRNTQQIAREISSATGAEISTRTIDEDAGLPVERKILKKSDDLIQALVETVDRLVDRDKVPINDIIILSPRRLENSDLADIERISGYPIADITDRNIEIQPQSIRFSTIHAFKGLESKAVVIVGIDGEDSSWMRMILYVGMSRAQSLLVLMSHSRARSAQHR